MGSVFAERKNVTKTLAKMGRVIKPFGEHTMRWSLIALAVLVALLEIDRMWATESMPGPIYRLWNWVWNTLLTYKTVTFCLGLLTYHMLLRHKRAKRESGIRESVFKTAPIQLDLATLEEHAKKMGVELHLTDDPRIMARNQGLPMREADNAPQAAPAAPAAPAAATPPKGAKK